MDGVAAHVRDEWARDSLLQHDASAPWPRIDERHRRAYRHLLLLADFAAFLATHARHSAAPETDYSTLDLDDDYDPRTDLETWKRARLARLEDHG